MEQAGKAGRQQGRAGQAKQAALLLGSQSWPGKCLSEPRELATAANADSKRDVEEKEGKRGISKEREKERGASSSLCVANCSTFSTSRARDIVRAECSVCVCLVKYQHTHTLAHSRFHSHFMLSAQAVAKAKKQLDEFELQTSLEKRVAGKLRCA